jgi:LEA14-like dessication related protein
LSKTTISSETRRGLAGSHSSRLIFEMTKLLALNAALFLAVAALFSGCLTTVDVSNVYVEVASYQPTQNPRQGQVTLRYVNDNIYPLAIKKTSGSLYLDGKFVGRFSLNAPVGVPQLTTVNHTATVNVENERLIDKLSTSSEPMVSYRLDVTLHVDLGEERNEYKDSRKGQISTASFRQTAEKK